jgi:hypothetical protein
MIHCHRFDRQLIPDVGQRGRMHRLDLNKRYLVIESDAVLDVYGIA